MPEFAYIARNSSGEKITGTLAASTEREVASMLASRSLFPVEVVADKATAPRQSGKRVKGQLMATAYGQLAALLRSGVPLLRSLNVLRNQTSHAGVKYFLADVHDRVEDGTTLADAMARHQKTCGEMAINMVRAGGEGGFLEDALERVAYFTEQQEDLKSRTIGAMAYPVFLATFGTLVVTVLVVFFVPSFEVMFEQLRRQGELPLLTDWLLWISATLNQWGLLIMAVLVMIAAFVHRRLMTEDGRRFRDLVKLRLPLAGPIFKSLAVARFCRVLGTLLHNGVPILKSLKISSEAAGNRILSLAISEASENISAGESLASPLRASGHFPPDVVEMISVAEESNTLEAVLTNIADGLERRTERRLDLMVRLLEPVMLMILAGMVLMVVIALLMPIMRLSSTIA